MFFKVMDICIFVFNLMLCIVIMFYVDLMKGGYLENVKLYN